MKNRIKSLAEQNKQMHNEIQELKNKREESETQKLKEWFEKRKERDNK